MVEGKFCAVCVDNYDPDEKGKLLVKIPTLTGDMTILAKPHGMVETEASGFLPFIPVLGSKISVEYIEGELVWTDVWHDETKPSQLAGVFRQAYGAVRGFFTHSGSGMTLDDTPKSEKVGVFHGETGDALELTRSGILESTIGKVQNVVNDCVRYIGGKLFESIKGDLEQEILGSLIQKVSGMKETCIVGQENKVVGEDCSKSISGLRTTYVGGGELGLPGIIVDGLKIQKGDKEVELTLGNYKIVLKSFTLGGDFVVEVQTGKKIKLGNDGASEQAVFGNELTTILLGHKHIGNNGAPTSTLIAPELTQLQAEVHLSNKVKIG